MNKTREMYICADVQLMQSTVSMLSTALCKGFIHFPDASRSLAMPYELQSVVRFNGTVDRALCWPVQEWPLQLHAAEDVNSSAHTHVPKHPTVEVCQPAATRLTLEDTGVFFTPSSEAVAVALA